jgi:cell division inhibitor SepF
VNLFEWQQAAMSQGQAQVQEEIPGQSSMSMGESGKPEVDLFPALADRKALSVVAPRAACNGTQISMFEPTSYEDALDIVECLRSRASTTICLEKMRKSEATRLVDFIAGASAAIDGAFHKLSEQVYLFAPSNVQIVVKDLPEPAAPTTESSFTTPPPSFSSTAAAFSGSLASFNSAPPGLNSPASSETSNPLDFLYPETSRRPGTDNIWTKQTH